MRVRVAIAVLFVCLFGCGRKGYLFSLDASGIPAAVEAGEKAEAGTTTKLQDAPVEKDSGDGRCTSCDSVEPSNPIADNKGGTGNITTYGSVTDPSPSRGGACNYGDTEIKYYAAINVNIQPEDGRGQWQGGKICGQCAWVRAKTSDGWKQVVVRIMDKCPDQYCGIDLGGAPAKALMDDLPGRYHGTWQFISCDGHPEVSDGSASIFVKDGSNPWWALVQVRNPPAPVAAIAWEMADGKRGDFAYATEAENFYRVPEEVRSTSEIVRLTVRYSDSSTHYLEITGQDLSQEKASYTLKI